MNDIQTSVGARRLRDPDAARTLLLLLLLTDLLFILLHVADAALGFSEQRLFDLGRDRAYPELFQYLKFLWAAKLLVLVAVRSGAPGYLTWAGVFTVLLLDDSLRLHERSGKHVAMQLGVLGTSSVPGQALGELAVVAAAGLLLVALLLTVYVRGSEHFRHASRGIALRLLILVFFGVGVDFLHSATSADKTLASVLGLVEDGGELVSVSLIVGYLLAIGGVPGRGVSDGLRAQPITSSGPAEP